MLIKFNSSLLPSAEIITLLNLREMQLAPGVFGWVATDNTGDVYVNNGDYFIVNGNDFKIIARDNYIANTDMNRLVVKEISIELMENIIQSFVNMAITDAVKLSIIVTINPTLTAIVGNKLQFARAIYVATATTTNFTTGIKNAGLSIIDAAIAKL